VATCRAPVTNANKRLRGPRNLTLDAANHDYLSMHSAAAVSHHGHYCKHDLELRVTIPISLEALDVRTQQNFYANGSVVEFISQGRDTLSREVEIVKSGKISYMKLRYLIWLV